MTSAFTLLHQFVNALLYDLCEGNRHRAIANGIDRWKIVNTSDSEKAARRELA